VARIRLETIVPGPPEQVFDLARDIDFHQRSMSGSGERAVAGRTSGLIGPGESVTWRATHLGLNWQLTSRITSFDRPNSFVDDQQNGPFASFRHAHRFEKVDGRTRMLDDWHHELRYGLVGRIVDRVVVGRLMRRLLRARAKAIAEASADLRAMND